MDTHSQAVAQFRRISGPVELLQAIPYLLGFHPTRSLVLVGLHDGALVVTARLDLADARHRPTLEHTFGALVRGGTSAVVAAVFDDDAASPTSMRDALAILASELRDVAELTGLELPDVLLTARRRWWSLCCTDPRCCPRDGQALPDDPSPFAAAATVDGVVALPDRAAVAALLEPLPEAERAHLRAPVEGAATAPETTAARRRVERARTRELFAAARRADEPGWSAATRDEVVSFGAALTSVEVRDAVWTAIDTRRLDGRPLWRDLARRLPSPYDAPPLFLFGWAAWRSGNGALASIAAQRTIESDPSYSAADLLLAALAQAIDPRRLRRMRQRRPA